MPMKPSRRRWTAEEEERLRHMYGNVSMRSLMVILGRPDRAIYAKAEALGLKRSEEYLAGDHSGRIRRGQSIGDETKFQKGQTPWNKGIHFDPGGRSATTRFKPGTLNGKAAQLLQPVGAERVTDDGIRQRKVTDEGPPHRRWKSVHSLMWEEAYGPIPQGHLVVFRDRNPNNLTLDNLELVSRAENMRRNTIHRYPPELKDTIRQLGKLRRAINEAAHEKQDD